MSGREYYQLIRRAARENTEKYFISLYPYWSDKLKLSPIDDSVFLFLENHWDWGSNPDKYVGDPDSWRTTTKRYKKSFQKYIDLAVWFDGKLVAVLLGKISKGKTEVSINFLEGNNDSSGIDGNRLKVCTIYATLIAEELGARKLIVKNPLPTARPHYCSLGFREPQGFRRKHNVLEMQL